MGERGGGAGGWVCVGGVMAIVGMGEGSPIPTPGVCVGKAAAVVGVGVAAGGAWVGCALVGIGVATGGGDTGVAVPLAWVGVETTAVAEGDAATGVSVRTGADMLVAATEVGVVLV